MADRVVFLFNLLQDVSVLRPLVLLASRETDRTILMLVSKGFRARDKTGSWRAELKALRKATNALERDYASPAEAVAALQGAGGVILAGSESDLSAHHETHEVFRAAPASYLKVTLQHGLECVGFRHTHEHVLRYGRNVGFAADVLCAWQSPDRLTATKPAERGKLLVTGPTSLLNQLRSDEGRALGASGLICENLHSVRLQTSAAHGGSFMAVFSEFCTHLQRNNRTVTLRPHPGGQYVLRNKLTLPGNVAINNNPIYKVDLGAYSFGLSAPSTIVLDMVLAGLPTAVWRDEAGTIDTRGYDGLTPVSTLADWIGFMQRAEDDPEPFRALQQRWLEALGLQVNRNLAYRAFCRLLAANQPHDKTVSLVSRGTRPRNIVVFANGDIPTLQIWFTEPLQKEVEENNLVLTVLTETEMNSDLRKDPAATPEQWIRSKVRDIDPDLVVSCRYSGPAPETIVAEARNRGCAFLYHIDDDLLDLPPEIGEKKFAFHMDPKRLGSVRHQLGEADLIYCSTDAIARRVDEHGFRTEKMVGEISCFGAVLREPQRSSRSILGYMGGADHAADFALVAPQVLRVLRENDHVDFEVFGSFQIPADFEAFGNRVRRRAPVRGYSAFMQSFAELGWNIGIAPLVKSRFNSNKSLNKWVEYTAVGAATVASAGTAYDVLGDWRVACLVPDDGWHEALTRLVREPSERVELTMAAQDLLRKRFSIETMRKQTLEAFEAATRIKGQKLAAQGSGTAIRS